MQVAHGVTIGRDVLLAARSASPEHDDSGPRDACRTGGRRGHITIGKGTIATAQTGIPNSVEPGSFVSGYPAISNRDWLKSSAVFRKLPELRRTIADLQARLAKLEARIK